MDQPLPPIRLFKVGTFTSQEGTTVSFSEADLAGAAAAFDPVNDPAPLVIGHPQTDDPAWGWVESLSYADGELNAVPKNVEPAFAELVRAGRYSRVSARFYPPAHPANPKPGSLYLKHIGFLGAMAPGVKGLGTVQFSAADDGDTLTFDLTMEQNMKELSFAEQTAALDQRAKELDAREDVITQKEEAASKAATQARHASNLSFAEGLIAATTLAPALKDLTVGVLDQLDATAMISFGEEAEMTPADAFRKILSSGKPLINLGEAGAKKDEGGGFTSFAAPDGYTVDAASADLFSRAQLIQNDNPNLAWMDCVRRARAAG